MIRDMSVCMYVGEYNYRYVLILTLIETAIGTMNPQVLVSMHNFPMKEAGFLRKLVDSKIVAEKMQDT